MASRGGSRAGSLTVAALVGLPALVLAATPAGRGVVADGFMQLAYSVFPASALLVLLSLGRVVDQGWARTRLAGALVAVAGVTVGFEAARLISGMWLIVGRALKLEPLFLATVTGAMVALIGGILALVQGARQARGAEGRGVPTLAGLAIVLVPLVPVFLLTGDGVALIVFDDLAEPRFSPFPGDRATLGALLTMLAGHVVLLVAGLADPGPDGPRWPVHVGVLLGSTAVVAGFIWHIVRGLTVPTGAAGGALWPGLNGVTVLLGLAAGWRHLADASDASPSSVAFQAPDGDRR